MHVAVLVVWLGRGTCCVRCMAMPCHVMSCQCRVVSCRIVSCTIGTEINTYLFFELELYRNDGNNKFLNSRLFFLLNSFFVDRDALSLFFFFFFHSLLSRSFLLSSSPAGRKSPRAKPCAHSGALRTAGWPSSHAFPRLSPASSAPWRTETALTQMPRQIRVYFTGA